MLVRATVMIVIMLVRVMMVGMNLVDESSLFEQRMRCHGGPDGRQEQRKHASDKPHEGEGYTTNPAAQERCGLNYQLQRV